MSGEADRDSRGPASLASLLLSNYSIYPGTILTAILLVEIAETFDTSVGVVSQIRTLSSVLGFVTALAMGALSVRYGGRRLLAAGLLLLSLSCVGSAAAPSLVLLFALYSLNGVASNVVFPMLTSLVGEYYPPEGRARVMGWIGASGGADNRVPGVGGELEAPFRRLRRGDPGGRPSADVVEAAGHTSQGGHRRHQRRVPGHSIQAVCLGGSRGCDPEGGVHREHILLQLHFSTGNPRRITGTGLADILCGLPHVPAGLVLLRELHG